MSIAMVHAFILVAGLLRLLRLLQLGRLVQYLTAKGVLQRFESKRTVNYDKLALFQFAVALLMVMHLLGE